jgi:hypothetical protein
MRYIKTLAGDLYPVNYSLGIELYELLYKLPLEIKCIQQCTLFYQEKQYFPLTENHPPEEAVIDLIVVPRYQLPDVTITAEEREYYTTRFESEPRKEYLVWIDNKEMKALCLFKFYEKNILYHSYCLDDKIPVSIEVQQRFEYLNLCSISK